MTSVVWHHRFSVTSCDVTISSSPPPPPPSLSLSLSNPSLSISLLLDIINYNAPFIHSTHLLIQNSVSNFNWSQAQRGLSGKITLRRSIRRDEKLLVLVGCTMHWLIGGSSSDRLYNAPFAERAWLASISKTVSNLEDVTALCRDQVSHSLTIMISRNTWIVPQPVVSNHHLFFLESNLETS